MQYYRNSSVYRRRRLRLLGFKTDIVTVGSILKIIFFGLLGFVILFFILVIWYSRDLPTPGKLANPNLHDSTKIMDKNGLVLYSIYKDYNRIYVPLNEIPKSLRDATIVSEDKDFYKNQGFSLVGYLRSVKNLVLTRRVSGGGSTITQQLVKTVLLTPEQSISRKIKELILSLQVDQKYSKDQILEMYLNDVSYGGTAIGVEAASNLYFGKHVKDLRPSESAFLAGLPQAPSYYSPYTTQNKAYVDRTRYVLDRLFAEKYISAKEKDVYFKEIQRFKFSEKEGSFKAPHFVMYVRDKLIKMFGENMVEKGNLKVMTTLDYDIQKNAEGILKSELDKLKGYNVGNGSAIVLDPKSGAILSMVGSRDYFDTENDGNFNTSTSLRQPGSSLKPIMYATAFEKGYTPSTLIMDIKTDFPTLDPEYPIYTPENYDGKYRGPVQIRFALGNSLNIPAVKMLAKVGIKPVMQQAYDMGIENWKPTTENLQKVGLSLILGGREASLLQITGAYSVFAANGIKREPFAIKEVKDANGKTIYKHEDQQGERVLSSEISYLISHILLDNNARQDAFGASSWLVIPGKTVSVKTGTTDLKRDNWTIGYTPSYVVGVWVGNNNNTPMNPVIASGITGASPIWNKIIHFILKDKKDEQFQKLDNVTALEIDAFLGGLPVDGQAKRTEYFVKGTEPTTVSQIYKTFKVSKKQTSKLANQDELNHGDYDLKDYIVFQETDPVSTDNRNRWQDAIGQWLKDNHKDDSKYLPPTEASDYKYEQPTPTPTVTSTPTPTPTVSTTPSPTP
ncbi:MAG: hypothetical protein A2857_00120 [Candidatus Levybacteria bacterium RIFCSPHIGHO2_01_FULL_36_15]|nr:MAG: hypothetical protein A2857_00120 [Candidatus Levybacteria bacterium RIFCSPHIGHO2_01_FULL_36_15]